MTEKILNSITQLTAIQATIVVFIIGVIASIIFVEILKNENYQYDCHNVDSLELGDAYKHCHQYNTIEECAILVPMNVCERVNEHN